MTVFKWSQTAATNSNVDATINWAEGQAPSSVNDSSRAMMAALAKQRDDNSGALVLGGSSTAATVTTNQGFTALTDGLTLVARIGTTNGAALTLNVDALGAKAVHAYTATAVPTGVLLAGSTHKFTYDLSDDVWYVSGFFLTTSVTLAAVSITGAVALTAPAIDDELPIYDLSTTTNKKITPLNLFKVVNAFTAETAPAIDDELLLYDLSATAADKITLLNLFKVIDGFTADATPDRELDYFVTYDASATAPKKVLIKNAITPGAIMCIAEDNQTSGTDGATLTSGADTVRALNTLVFNRGTMASIASNRLTLPAGTWEIEWFASVGGDVDINHQSFLYNFSDTAEVKRGTSARYDVGDTIDDSNTWSMGSTVVTIAASKAFEIRHRTNGAGTIRQGVATSFGTEVYTRVIVRAA